ncbi:AraC family transcriptional regulator [Bacteroides helcogenes]|uniref:Transcriptional regulator, AraC family n=1 Tax=Bacteroides helcogenes (strain ATCC 35417 / DSM 20613 / JCM 6297 / CCUG 15421 / P 36-108) TaxID=693979 RepID=E6SQN4_BACT6|nr:AraC family transcriptional regulator [Bacteroides helcogenes]ADV43008.1 transcriptional regulator, AraC family [Bacteroides helcogenes P 36-108]MDY5236949.1 AraC family transcriptional regulator [Bacteroides helcogenes]
MIRDNIFTKYDLEEGTPDEVQFEIMEMPQFFHENGDAPKQAHIHSFYQIIWFQHGTGVHYVDFKEYPITDNTLFFISPGQIHYFDENNDAKGVIIHFNESFLSDEGSSENVFLKYNVFNAFDAAPYYEVTSDDTPRLEYIIEEMQLETGHTTAFAHKDYLKYLVKMFLICVQRIGKRGIGIPLCINNSSNRTFVRFRQILEHHYRQLHTVKEYAARLNVSAKTLTNCVYESAHSTPLKIINERIILEAKRQLLHSDLKVKEIAFYLGFEDPSYFVKFFKRQTGYLPAEFRE